MKLIPLGKRVVLKELVAEETTKSGIVLTGQSKEKPQEAEVVAVGEVSIDISVGDKVFYKKYAGTNVKLDEEEYIIMDEEDVLAVIK
ncbi:MAG: co-chaperone GroES [Lachnospiraceae bacterium]|nr:co-chaperone GroES [Lachnospiraceae bacterium]